jgi:hypothetical protein
MGVKAKLKYRALALGVAWRCVQTRVRLLGRGLPAVQEMRREADVMHLKPTNQKIKNALFTELNGKIRQHFNIFQRHLSDQGGAGWNWNSAPLP